MRRARYWLIFLVVPLFALGACAPRLQVPGLAQTVPIITCDTYIASDGKRLALASWHPTGDRAPVAVLIALHGFNDYRHAFDIPAADFARAGILTLAYDQRGFGADDHAGIWAGGEVMANDLTDFIGVVKAEYPDLPVFVLGESMGAAVVLLAMGRKSGAGDPTPPPVDGIILVAPAVWGWETMNRFYRATLWMSAHLTPGWHVTGAGLDIHPSDNIEMLRAFSRDPLVIGKTRIDAVYGLVGLMQAALDSAAEVEAPITVLVGEKDDIIPRRPITLLRQRLPAGHEFLSYSDGYHMLLRDLCRAAPISDIAAIVTAGTTGATGTTGTTGTDGANEGENDGGLIPCYLAVE